jgi:nucleotide-binding universal stress UspA family protein
MFKRNLVPLDGLSRAVEAIEFVRTLALVSDASLTLLHVEPWGASVQDARCDQIQLDALLERLRIDGLEAHAVLRFDDPKDGIASTAALENADLIVLAPHVREGLDALVHPSVTTSMLTRSPAPLLIFPDPMPYIGAMPLLHDRAMRILVPLDGTQRAEMALPLAMDLARHYDRELLLARASAPPAYVSGTEMYIPSSGYVHSYRQESETYLEEIAAYVRSAGLRVRTKVLAGPPEAELTALYEAERIGLTVLCTHGRTGAARLLIGSVARHLIYHATAPLIVLPPRYLALLSAPTLAQQTTAG